jgi:beta-lactam-binding protein with PASTA domain
MRPRFWPGPLEPGAVISERRRSERLPAIAAITGAIVFACVVGGASSALASVPPITQALGTHYPAVEGLPLIVARQMAQTSNLELVITEERVSEAHGRDTVIRQSPAPGWRIFGNNSLHIIVSQGLLVPDVRGTSAATAQAQTASIGWNIRQVNITARGDAAPIVMQHPAPGTIVDEPGDLAVVVEE